MKYIEYRENFRRVSYKNINSIKHDIFKTTSLKKMQLGTDEQYTKDTSFITMFSQVLLKLK